MEWIKKLIGNATRKVLAPFVSKYVGSFLRTWLAVGAGYLVAKGYVTEEVAAEAARANYDLIMGVVTALTVQLASLTEKKKRDK